MLDDMTKSVEETSHWIMLNLGVKDLLPHFGWKIHLSCTPPTYEEAINKAAKISEKHGIPFKYAKDVRTLLALNAGEHGDTQVGKDITLYAKSWAQAQAIFLEMRSLFRDPLAPKIPTDLYYDPQDSVALRYGRLFAGNSQDDEEDVRVFGAIGVGTEIPEINGRRLFIHPMFSESTLLSNAGGYQLLQAYGRKAKPLWIVAKQNADPIVAKVAYRGFGFHSEHINHQTLLEHEYHQLLRLVPSGKVPKPLGMHYEAWLSALLTEEIVGDSLEKMPLVVAKSRFSEIVELVSACHEAGIVHLDLKLANILLDVRKGKLVLIDFELSRMHGEALSLASGTPFYKAPEVLPGSVADFSMDVYSLGIILAHICLGRDPWHMQGKAASLADIVSFLGFSRAAQLIEACTHDDPQKRITLQGIKAFVQEGDLFIRKDKGSGLAPKSSFTMPPLVDNQWSNLDFSFTGSLGGIVLSQITAKQLARPYHQRVFTTVLGHSLSPSQAPSKPRSLGWNGDAGKALALALASQIVADDFLNSSLPWIRSKIQDLIQQEPGNYYSLESGLAGLIFVCSKLALILNDSYFVKLAQDAVQKLQWTVSHGFEIPQGSDESAPLGLYQGLSGLAFALFNYAQVAEDDHILAKAESMIQHILNHGVGPHGYLRSQIKPDSRSSDDFHWGKGLIGPLWVYIQMADPTPSMEKRMLSYVERFDSTLKLLSPHFAYGCGGLLDFANLLRSRFPNSPDLASFQRRCLLLAKHSLSVEKTSHYESGNSFYSFIYGCVLTPLIIAKAERDDLGSILDNSNLILSRPC